MNLTLSSDMFINAVEHFRDAISDGRREDAMAKRKAQRLCALTNVSGGGSFSKTDATFHDWNIRRDGGRFWKMPLISLEIVGWFPIEKPSMGGRIEEIADRCTKIVLYALPSSNRREKYSITVFRLT